MIPILLTLHLVGFALVSTGVILSSSTAVLARSAGSIDAHRLLARLVARAAMMSAIGGWTLILTGSGLVFHVGYGFGAPWVSASFAVWIGMLLCGVIVFRPHALRVAEAVERPDMTVEGVTRLYALPAVRIGLRVHEILYLVALGVMVFKPGA